MTTLKTATGKEYYCDFMGTASSIVLYVRIQIDLNELIEVFQNPEETRILQLVNEKDEVLREERLFIKLTEFTIVSGPCPVRIRLERDIDAIIQAQLEQME